MNNCRLDNLPVELIHHLLSYFSAHEIFYTFTNVSSYLNAVLIAYSSYQINFKSISKTNFELVCQRIIPDQVIALTLSSNENTPGSVELFLSRFQINQFTRLQSLRLIEIGPDLWENIMIKLVELKNLHSFSFIGSSRNNPWMCNLSANDVTQLDIRLSDIYAPILPQLYQLRLMHGDFLKSIQFPRLRHLVLERSTVDIIKHICSVAPQLESLDTSFPHDVLNIEFIYPLIHLKRLVLQIQDLPVSMNDIERMMSNLPHLKHLELTANCSNDVADGQRWQNKVKYLITFKFMFNLSVQLESQDLDSFRTPFWLEEKRWFVAYTYKCLFSVPDFNKTETNEVFQPPIYSTVPDNKVFYESIDKLHLSEISDNVNHYFNHVRTLTLSNPILLPAVERIVNLSQVQHLILSYSMKNFPILAFINEMPNLCQISIRYKVKYFLKEIRCKTIEKIRTLEIGNSFMAKNDYDVEKLCNVFPNIEHLRVVHECSTIQIFNFLDRLKHLSTASFRYVSWFTSQNDAQQCRFKIQSVLNRIRRIHRFNYTYRFGRLSVYIWV